MRCDLYAEIIKVKFNEYSLSKQVGQVQGVERHEKAYPVFARNENIFTEGFMGLY